MNKEFKLALAGTVAFCALIVLRFCDPASSGIYPPCPVHFLTGWYCPGCGSLRALHQLLHGNLRGALALNPMAVMFLPFLVYGMASWVRFELCGRYLPHVVLPAGFIRGLGAAIILFGILRNVPVYPLNLLAPGAWL